MFEIFARCKDFGATPLFSARLRLVSFATTVFPNPDHEDTDTLGALGALRLRGLRHLRVLPLLPLALFFSVSPWLCGEYSFGCGYAPPCASVAKSVLCL